MNRLFLVAFGLAAALAGALVAGDSLGKLSAKVFRGKNEPAWTGCVAQANVRTGLVDRLPAEDGCAPGRGVRSVHHVAVSADDRFIYAASGKAGPMDDGALTVFKRDLETGEFHQLPGALGCLKRIDPPLGLDGCGQARQLDGVRFVTATADNRYLYTGGYTGIAIFRRDIETGTLQQLPGPSGCVGLSRTECSWAPRPEEVEDIAFSQDGRFAYAASARGAVLTFRRDPELGTLELLPGPDGCIVSAALQDHCRLGRAIARARAITLSPDEHYAYVADLDDALAIFRRDRESGVLTQLADQKGCHSETGKQGCMKARGLFGPHRLTITRDGRHAYLAGKGAEHKSGLAVFRRDLLTGELVQLEGTTGCFTEDASDGCAQGRVIKGAHAALLDAPEHTLYLSSDRAEGGIAIFRRDPATGTLQQLPGALGCMSPIEWQGCRVSRRTGGIHIIAMTRDGRFAYAAGEGEWAVLGYRISHGKDEGDLIPVSTGIRGPSS